MSMLMIRPGPLEGGPKVSPGSAKSGEDFSAHFKQAFDGTKKEIPSEPSNRVLNQPKPDGASAPSPHDPKGDLSQNGSEKGAEVVSEGVATVPVVPENPKNTPVAIPMNILVVEPGGEEMATAQGNAELSQENRLGDNLMELPLISNEKSKELPAESEPKKEDQAPSPVKLLAFPVLPPIGLVVVQPADLNPQIETEEAVAAPPEGSAIVPVALETTPTVDGQKSQIDGAKNLDLPPKRPDPKTSTVPLGLKEPAKKPEDPEPISIPGEGNKKNMDRPGDQLSLDPHIKTVRAGHAGSVILNQDKEVRRETALNKEPAAPATILQPDVIAQVPLTADAVSHQKETPGLAPIRSREADPGGGPVHSIPGTRSSPAPVSDVAHTNAERPAPPVVTPSPLDLARQIHVHLESGRSVVRIDLHPNHLGELRISMETKGKDVSMQFTVDNDQARTAVVAGMREISGTLSSLGWNVNGLAVHVSSGGVGDGRGETPGALWGQGKSNSNALAPETEPVDSSMVTGHWRVNLVA